MRFLKPLLLGATLVGVAAPALASAEPYFDYGRSYGYERDYGRDYGRDNDGHRDRGRHDQRYDRHDRWGRHQSWRMDRWGGERWR